MLSVFNLVLILFNPSREAHSENYFIVTGSTVNIRSGPGISYDVLDKVKRGTFVVILDLKGEWTKVYYLKEENKGSSGWINIRYLAAAPSFEEEEEEEFDVSEDDIFSEEKIDPSEAQVSLRITDADFKCKQNLFGEGFDKCILEISYSVSSDYEGDLDVTVDCDATFELNYKDSYSSKRKSESESDSISLNGGYGSGNMEITIRPSAFETLTKAAVKDLSCRASNNS